MTSTPRVVVRPSGAADVSAVQAVILAAAHQMLAKGPWSEVQVDAAEQAGMFELDAELVAAGRYYVVEIDCAIAGGSGWSAGGRVIPAGDAAPGDPGSAVMRATYVDPAWARRGLGTLLARTTETAARVAGFDRFEALCTPMSAHLRRSLGYEPVGDEEVEALPGITVPGTRMRRTVG